MVQRSRIAPPSDLRSLKKSRGRGSAGRAVAVLKNAAMLVLLVALFFTLPKILGPGFWHDQARGVVAFLHVAGDWLRAALSVAFLGVPVR